MKTTLLILLFAVVNLSANAADTSRFRTEYHSLLKAPANDALEQKEALPADQFPEGNWGVVTNGFQLSLRFDKTNFTVGEPVTATVLFRNTTTNSLRYMRANVAGEDGPISFRVWGPNGAVTSSSDPKLVISAGEIPLFPMTQCKYRQRLTTQSTRFDLSASGSYTVQAYFRTGCPQCVEITSGKVAIYISEK